MPEIPVADKSYLAILLSTYNGSRYLRAQLDSLYCQVGVDIRILVRDDGSADDTLTILQAEAGAGHLTIMSGGQNLGPAMSFLALLRQAMGNGAQYAAFCDQDDVWRPEKMTRALDMLRGKEDHPAMICTRVELVDEMLRPIGFLPIPKRKIGLGNALVEDIATGCTIVLNRKAIELVCAYWPDRPQMHDWWCYLVLSCMGEVIYDPWPSLLYRQHGNNVVGVARTPVTRLLKRFRRFLGKHKQPAWCTHHARLLLDGYGNQMAAEHRILLQRFVRAKTDWKTRIGLAFSPELWRQGLIDTWIMRALMVMNLL